MGEADRVANRSPKLVEKRIRRGNALAWRGDVAWTPLWAVQCLWAEEKARSSHS